MKVKVKDKEKKVRLHKILRPAVEFFRTELKIKKLDNVNLQLAYWRPIEDAGQAWYCKDKKLAEIELNGKLSECALIVTLAHEMVHISQFADGRLQHDEGGNWVWEDVNYGPDVPTTGKKYYKLPWETEAWTLQTDLSLKYYNKIITQMKF